MKNRVVFAVGCCALLLGQAAWAAPDFKNDLEKNSYALGVNMINQLKRSHTDFEVALVAKGVRDQAAGKSLLADGEIDAAMNKVNEESQKKAREAAEKLAAENKKRSAAFLAENAKKEGVKTLPSGVQYRVLQAGSGSRIANDDMPVVNYRGTLQDGKVFMVSQPGIPDILNLKRVIPGWREALTQMTIGSKWEVVIPPEQGFGEKGARNVGPNEALILEVELVGIE